MLKIDGLIAGILAYVTVLAMAAIVSPLAGVGAKPHLIALFAPFFLRFGRVQAGLWWIVVGASMIDLILPYPIGITLGPTLAVFLILVMVSRRLPGGSLMPWLPLSAGLALCAAELPLASLTGNWRQLGLDLGVGTLLVIPLALLAEQRLWPLAHGLRLMNRGRRGDVAL